MLKNPAWPGFSTERCNLCGQEWDIWQMFTRLSRMQSLIVETFCPKCTFKLLIEEHGFESPPSSRKRWAWQKGEKKAMAKITPELLAGSFLSLDTVTETILAKIVVANIEPGTFGARVVLTLVNDKKVSLNRTSLAALVKRFGNDTDNFAGKRVRIENGLIKNKPALVVSPA